MYDVDHSRGKQHLVNFFQNQMPTEHWKHKDFDSLTENCFNLAYFIDIVNAYMSMKQEYNVDT